MGSCITTSKVNVDVAAEALTNKKIDAEFQQMIESNFKVKKLLLLGTGESGKSTLYRQMKRIYGVGFSNSELEDFKLIITSNTISFMQALVASLTTLEPALSGTISPDLFETRDIIAKLPQVATYNVEIAQLIGNIWKDPVLHEAFERRSELQIPDCAEYFFDRAVQLAEPDYVPTDTDVLMSRMRTTGILHTRFRIAGTEFDIFDVGGQRNERRKWIHCFENVTAVLFVVALSEYDQMLFEDQTTNRMTESLQLFEETVNCEWFVKIDIIVFLNKKDLLIEKMKKVPISKYFPEYTGGNDIPSAFRFFMQMFISRNRRPSRGIYCHMTTATDESNVVHVFSAVRDIIMKKGMLGTGLL